MESPITEWDHSTKPYSKSSPLLKSISCPDNDFDGKCGVETATVVNRCPDNDHNYVCEWYLATDGVWYTQGEGPTIVNDTVIPPQVTPQDACYNKGFHDGTFGMCLVVVVRVLILMNTSFVIR